MILFLIDFKMIGLLVNFELIDINIIAQNFSLAFGSANQFFFQTNFFFLKMEKLGSDINANRL